MAKSNHKATNNTPADLNAQRLASLKYPYVLEFAGGRVLIEQTKQGSEISYLYNIEKITNDLIEAFSLGPAVQSLHELIPYIEDAITPATNGGMHYGKLTACDVLKIIDINGDIIEPDNKFCVEIYNNALANKKAAEKRQRAADARAKQKQQIGKVDITRLDSISYKQSTDTVIIPRSDFTNNFFSLIPSFKIVNGQYTMISTFKHGSSLPITMPAVFTQDTSYLKLIGLHDSDFNTFNDYDFFVAAKCDKMFLEGNNIITPTKLLKELGVPASKKQIDELMKSIYKGKSTNALVNNKEILDAWGVDYDKEHYQEIDRPILQVNIKHERSRVNGNVTGTQIEICSLSLFHDFDKLLNHVTTWDDRIFTQYTGKRTKKYWSILRYLLLQIGWMRADNSTRANTKITMAAVYEFAGDTDKDKRRASREMIIDLLDEIFEPLDYISGYEREDATIQGAQILQSVTLKVKGFKLRKNITKKANIK